MQAHGVFTESLPPLENTLPALAMWEGCVGAQRRMGALASCKVCLVVWFVWFVSCNALGWGGREMRDGSYTGPCGSESLLGVGGGGSLGAARLLAPLTTGRWGIEPLPSILSLFVALGCAESGHTPGRLS